MSEEPQLAPSTRAEEASDDKKGLQISYYVNVHCEVSLAKDLIVKIPFIISGSEKKEGKQFAQIPPPQPMPNNFRSPPPIVDIAAKKVRKDSSQEVLAPETELLVTKLVSLGYPKMLATQALKNHNDNFEKAFDWLKAHKAEPGSESPPPVGDQNFLISFEDAEQGQDDNVPGQYDAMPDFAAVRSGKVSPPLSSFAMTK